FIWIFTKSKTPGTSPQLPPGPRGFPVVGSLPFLDTELHTHFQALSQSYGPIFKLRLGSKLAVVVSSPTLVREMFKDQDITFANHDVPLTARAATYGGIDILWMPYGPEWRTLRKVCVLKLLSRQTLDSFYELRRHEIRQRARYLYEQAREGSPVNIGDQMFLTLLDLMVNMLWGETLKRVDEMANLGEEFKQVIAEIVRLLGEPNVSDFFPWLARFDLQGHVKEMKLSARKLDEMFNRAIEQCQRVRDDGNGDCKDFLQHLLKLKEEGDTEVPITTDHIKAMLMDLVTAGTDTSSNVVEFAMAELINRPEIMKRAQQELDEVIGKDNIVEESHISKLPYLLAVMKETLRLHPTIPLLVPHSPTETAIVGGYVIPKGSKVFVNAWAIHRDPNIWENPLEFYPERFLDESFDFSGNDHSFIPFGSGRRICVGISLAEKMVMYSLAMLLHSFDWKIPEGTRFDIEEQFGIVLKLKNPLIAIPMPRLSDSNLYM
ncbi:PREDICTED: flavonoid 3',5'-hydroxylase-like, partial [Tarenaya hassleriana]|uniref:flavonoid 3',5'-hydroxylase-like n=1 Tax=Tarenaya hassleriana TaxID=28532 RepID=UPI00053C650D